MPTFNFFEDIEAWQQARELTKEIYKVTKREKLSKDFELKNQLTSASISISSNIAEGFERGGNKEFQQFLSIAKGSVGEVKSQLYIALDQQYIDKNECETIYKMASNIGNMIGGLIQYLKSSSQKGIKYKD